MPERLFGLLAMAHRPARTQSRLWLVAVLGLALAGCASSPTSPRERVPLDVPLTWSTPSIGLNDAPINLPQWWLQFADPQLTDLITQALDANTDILLARAAAQQALVARDAAAAATSPTLSFSTSAQRSYTGDGGKTDLLQAGLIGNLDTDIFGAQGSALDASTSALQATRMRLGQAQSQVAANVVLSYITLRSAQVRLSISSDNLASQLETLQITRWRNQAGLIGNVEVEQALVATGQTRAQLAPLRNVRDTAMHSLAAQLGKPPMALVTELLPVSRLPQAPPNMPTGTPRSALDMRADVRAAKFEVDRSLALVEQARAARLPKLALGANLGVGAATLQALSTSAAAVGALALSLTGPILDGGAGEANVRLQQATLVQAQTNYRAAELLALQQSEDAMGTLRSDQEQLALLQQLALAAGNAATLARQQFEAGLVDFQVVLETQRSLLSIQTSLAQSYADVSTDQVHIYSALGGGWNPNAPAVGATPTPSP
jgi:NodT family efflux transporter outer membrane factor (OMF) lipoprotein